MFVLGDFTPEESLFLVSILHVGKGPTTMQTPTLKLKRIQTIKNLVHQQKISQLPIKIQHRDDKIILTYLPNDIVNSSSYGSTLFRDSTFLHQMEII